MADDLILDLRELVDQTEKVMLSSGVYEMRRITSLSPIERAKVTKAQSDAQQLMDQEFDESEAETFFKAQADIEDVMIGMALPGTSRKQRDAIPGHERAAVLAAFFGASGEMAKATALEVARMQGTPTLTGENSSPGSSASTTARRKNS
jgi:hypothetical protein